MPVNDLTEEAVVVVTGEPYEVTTDFVEIIYDALTVAGSLAGPASAVNDLTESPA